MRWNNVPGHLRLQISKETVPDFIKLLLKPDGDYFVNIDFLSSGYYDSGSMYGGDGGYPPGGCEERLLVRAFVEDDRKDGENIYFSESDQEKIFDFFYREVYEQGELEESD